MGRFRFNLRAGGTLRFLAVSVVLGCLLGPASIVSGARQEDDLDLAALILHTDDLNGLLDEMGLMEPDGYPYGVQFSSRFTSIDEALNHEIYAPGRGGFSLNLMGEETAADVLAEAGWQRSADEFLTIPEPGSEDEWSLGVAVSIEEFSTPGGAETAFAAFADEDLLETVTISNTVNEEDATLSFGKHPAMLWTMETTRYGGESSIVSTWVLVDNLIVSVALLHGNGYIAPDPALLEPLVELQLKRIAYAEYLYQPQLAACTPRLGGNQVFAIRDEYTALNGKAFASQNTSFTELEERQAEIEADGVVDVYIANQRIEGTAVGAYDGTMYSRGTTISLVDDDHAAAYLESAGAMLGDEPDYSDVEALRGVPNLGDEAIAYSYVGLDGNQATILYVQLDHQVFSIRLGSTTEVVLESVIELAETHLERVEGGNCGDPLASPGLPPGHSRARWWRTTDRPFSWPERRR